MWDNHRTQLEKFADLVGFIEFAFPAATAFLVRPEQRLGLTLRVTNIRKQVVKDLVIPKMTDWQSQTWADNTLVMDCTFPPDTWPELLPVFFLHITAAKNDEMPLTIVADACKKIARNELTPADYVVWAESYGNATSSDANQPPG